METQQLYITQSHTREDLGTRTKKHKNRVRCWKRAKWIVPWDLRSKCSIWSNEANTLLQLLMFNSYHQDWPSQMLSYKLMASPQCIQWIQSVGHFPYFAQWLHVSNAIIRWYNHATPITYDMWDRSLLLVAQRRNVTWWEGYSQR